MNLTILQQTMMQAMREKDMKRVTVLRNLIAAVKNKLIDKGSELTEEEVQSVIKKQLKETNESIIMYEKANNTSEVEELTFQKNIMESLLPKELTDEELELAVKSCIDECKKSANFDNKQLIPTVMKALKGKAGGNRIMPLIQKYS